jgi:hypothetical protein
MVWNKATAEYESHDPVFGAHIVTTEWQCLDANKLAAMIYATTGDKRIQTCYSSTVAVNEALSLSFVNSAQVAGLSGALRSRAAFKVGCGAYARVETSIEVPAADWYVTDNTEWGMNGFYAKKAKSTFR